jgi:hypothetical protein
MKPTKRRKRRERAEKEKELRGRMHSVERMLRSHLSVESEIPSTLFLPIDIESSKLDYF